ncbi:MAG: hypothetical protein ACYC46_04960 [Acidobacteriaceae bacterium]
MSGFPVYDFRSVHTSWAQSSTIHGDPKLAEVQNISGRPLISRRLCLKNTLTVDASGMVEYSPKTDPFPLCGVVFDPVERFGETLRLEGARTTLRYDNGGKQFHRTRNIL